MNIRPDHPVELNEAMRRNYKDPLQQNQINSQNRDSSGFGKMNSTSGSDRAELAKYQKFLALSQEPPNDSGQGLSSHLPNELRGGSWAGLLMNMIWGAAMRIPWTWLCLVPFVGGIMPFVMYYRGNEWAWQYKHWDSIAHFRGVQKKWANIGFVLSIIGAILFVVYISWMDSTYKMLMRGF